jgi:uncharacterized membrane-anchored protein
MKYIPKVTSIYWWLMIVATTTGEIVGNYISRDLGLGYQTGSILLISIFFISVLYTITTKNKDRIVYWILIILGNIGGTNIADLICIDLDFGTVVGSLLVMSALLVFILMMKINKNENSIYSMFFYWLAIITSSTFGTTSGDLLTNDTPLGAFGGSIFLAVLLLFSLILLRRKIISDTAYYWTAIILIHPIGATIGNYISKPIGLDFGNVWTSIFLIVLFIIIYYYQDKPSKIIGP